MAYYMLFITVWSQYKYSTANIFVAVTGNEIPPNSISCIAYKYTVIELAIPSQEPSECLFFLSSSDLQLHSEGKFNLV